MWSGSKIMPLAMIRFSPCWPRSESSSWLQIGGGGLGRRGGQGGRQPEFEAVAHVRVIVVVDGGWRAVGVRGLVPLRKSWRIALVHVPEAAGVVEVAGVGSGARVP